MGVSKRELFEDYYLDEIFVVLEEYARLKSPPDGDGGETEYVYADEWEIEDRG